MSGGDHHGPRRAQSRRGAETGKERVSAPSRILGYFLIPVFFSLVVLSHRFATRLREEADAEALQTNGSLTEAGLLRHEGYSLYLPGPTALKVGSLGNSSLAADYVWLKSIQYVSREFGEKEKWQKFEWLKRMYETLLELDPNWIQAVKLGGLFLGASGRGVDEATSILVQGMFKNPDSWILPYEVGVAYLFHPGRARETADFLQIAASRKDCPEAIRAQILRVLPDLNSMAGRLRKAEEQAWRLWKEHEGTRLGEIHRRKWVQSVARRIEQALTEAAERFEGLTGRFPSRVEELLEAGILRALPKEPFGLHWLPSARTRRVHSEGLINLFDYRAINAFNEVCRHFRRAKRRNPESLKELLRFGRLLLRVGGLPLDWGRYFETSGADPMGRPYVFDAERAEVVIPEEYTPERLFSPSLIDPRENKESPRDF